MLEKQQLGQPSALQVVMPTKKVLKRWCFYCNIKPFAKKKTKKKFTLYRTKHFLSRRYVANYTNNYPTLNSEMKTLFTDSAFAQQETNFFQHQWERAMEEKLPGQSLVVQFCRGRCEWNAVKTNNFHCVFFKCVCSECCEMWGIIHFHPNHQNSNKKANLSNGV